MYLTDNRKDAGGLCSNPDSQKNLYLNSLRSYQRCKSPTNPWSTPDYFAWAQVTRPTTADEQAKVKNLVQRLSSPRKKVTLKKATQHSVFKLKTHEF